VKVEELKAEITVAAEIVRKQTLIVGVDDYKLYHFIRHTALHQHLQA
jgi:hypothetical protein